MPTYEYKRKDGTIFEYRQGINDNPLTTCPETGQKVTRMISGGGGVVYKGDGWYVTDYKKSGSAPANGSSGDSGPEKKDEATSKKNEPSGSGE
ncbi:MAG: FmdB family zinc ribbon protein [Balneolaceae bacterium]